MRYYTIARTVLPKGLRQAIVKRVKAQPLGLREAFGNLLTEIKIARAVHRSAGIIERLRGAKGLKLHLGCGPHIKPGWVNIDLTLNPPQVDGNAASGTVFINYDLRLGLPLDSDSCDYIYSAHFLEHLEYRQGLQLLREGYRVLRPGGVFRLSLPNFKGMFEAYLRGDWQTFDLISFPEMMPDVEAGTETLMDIVNLGVYQNGEHKCVYDADKVLRLLRHIGYSSVTESSYQEEIDPEEELRRRYSFYVEAIK